MVAYKQHEKLEVSFFHWGYWYCGELSANGKKI